MGKRMTEPEKWRDPWFRTLTPQQKLVFLFLIDQCNWGGFYELDYGYMEFCIGIEKRDCEEAVKGLERGCVVRDGWVWIKNFLRHQKNEKLNPVNNAHIAIIAFINEQLTRFSDVPEFASFVGAYKGLLSPLGNGNGKGKNPYTANFEKFWDVYPRKAAKHKAAEIWKRDKLDTMVDEIIAKVQAYSQTDQWLKDGGKFIPHPTTFLNQRRYEDDVTPSTQSRFKELK